MIQEFGESALWATLIISSLRALMPVFLWRFPLLLCWRGQQVAAFSEFICLSIAFGGLVAAYIVSDFSLRTVADHSHTELSLFYRMTGTWGNHEGSMLLWVWILGLYGGIMAVEQREIPPFKLTAVALHGFLVALTCAYVLKTSNPFVLLNERVVQGDGLNPLLQDPALALHPPLLYLGYVGFAIPFCYALGGWLLPSSASITQHHWMESITRYDWVERARVWSLWAWSFLTAGIALGSLWAYYELGWGGWWFWDPVENAALLPWLTGTALLHTLVIVDKTKHLAKTAWFLAVISFILCLLGTFLVRSGILSTVHAFAQDAERGVYLLAITGLFILLAIGVGIKGIKQDQAQPLLMGVNLPSLISIKVYLFVVLTVTLLMGTLYPLLMEAVNGPAVSVGGPYFEKTFVPVGLFILVLMGFAPFVKWHHEPVIRVLRRSQWGIFLLLSAVLAILLVGNLWSLALWALIISFWLMLMTIGGRCVSLRAWRWQALFSGIACSGMVLAHIGCALMIIGMAGDQLGRSEEVVALKKGEAISFRGYTIKLIDITYRREATYIAEEAQIEVVKPEHRPVLLYPEKRFYPSFEALTTKTALMLENFSVLYLALGGVLPEDRWTLRLYYHPQVLWIWLGAAIMAVGGFQAWRKRRKKQHRIS